MDHSLSEQLQCQQCIFSTPQIGSNHKILRFERSLQEKVVIMLDAVHQCNGYSVH